MKKIFKTFIAALLLFLGCINVCVYASSQAQKKEFLENHSEILKSIKECAGCVPKKGDVRLSFIDQCTHNNDLQICMCENIIKCTDTKDVRNAAKALIKNAMECNSELNDIFEKVKTNIIEDKENEDKYLEEYNGLYKKMVSDLECSREDDDIDKIFLDASIKHHKCMIEIAKCVCKYTDDKDIKGISKDIVKNNEQEIKIMKKLIDEIS